MRNFVAILAWSVWGLLALILLAGAPGLPVSTFFAPKPFATARAARVPLGWTTHHHTHSGPAMTHNRSHSPRRRAAPLAQR